MFYKIIRTIKNFNNKKFNLLIFFVTNKCNISCKTCFYWKKLNKGGDLSLQEIKKIVLHIPKFKQLILSGGEPFLRDDLALIIKMFVNICDVEEIDIPTNGLLSGRVLNLTKDVLKTNQHVKIVVSVSWDGLNSINTKIRTGTTESANIAEIIKKLVELSRCYKNLEIQINTVVCKDNYKVLENFLEYLESQNYLGVKRHLFEIVRGHPKEPAESKFSLQEISELKYIYKKILNYQDRMFKYNQKLKNPFFQNILAGFNYANLAIIYKLQYDFFATEKIWPFRCASGQGMTAVMEHDGDIKLCELRRKIGSIKDNDFSEIINSKEAIKERDDIIAKKCSCSHICFIYPSLYHNMWMTFFKLPFEYLRYLIGVK